MSNNWKFGDPPNVAVVASRKVVFQAAWIYCVYHHAEDGAWEFHPTGGIGDESELAVVALRTIVEIDPSIATLCDLPLGWCAWRPEEQAPWQRMPMVPSV